MENQEYTLRPLQEEDLWPILDIIEKVIPEDMMDVAAAIAAKQTNIGDFGKALLAKLVMAIIRNMKAAKGEVYAFLSSVSGIPAADIQKMKMGTSVRMILEIWKNETNTDFLSAASTSQA